MFPTAQNDAKMNFPESKESRLRSGCSCHSRSVMPHATGLIVPGSLGSCSFVSCRDHKNFWPS